MTVESALFQELGHDFRLIRCIKPHLTAAQAVLSVREQVVQGNDRIRAGEVGSDVVGIGDADIGGGVRCDIGNDIVVNLAVVRIQPQIYRDIGIQRFEVRNGLLVDLHLGHVGIVLCPEGNLEITGRIKGFRDFKNLLLRGAVTAGKRCQQNDGKEYGNDSFHPFIPPLETPAMIFFRKIRNRTISGTEMTTTAAIMAGIFSRPKPFSRISWMPLDTRK